MAKKEKRICKFCGKRTFLCKAHIVPKFCYLLKQNGKVIEISSSGGIDRVYCQDGIKDRNILCHRCDNDFGVYEDTVSDILIKRLPRSQHQALDPRLGAYRPAPIYYLKLSKEEYGHVRKFFIATLWRMSISGLESCKTINLGYYEKTAFDILKGNIPDIPELFVPFIKKEIPTSFLNSAFRIRKFENFMGREAVVFNGAGYEFAITIDATNQVRNQYTNSLTPDGIMAIEPGSIGIDGDIFNFYDDASKIWEVYTEAKKRMKS